MNADSVDVDIVAVLRAGFEGRYQELFALHSGIDPNVDSRRVADIAASQERQRIERLRASADAPTAELWTIYLEELVPLFVRDLKRVA